MSFKKSSTMMSFLLIDQFAAMSLISAIESLRMANYVTGEELYRWQIVSYNGNKITASNGMVFEPAIELNGALETDYFFVVASLNFDPPYRSKLNSVLSQLSRRGIKMGAISLGSWILARAGLLEKAKCTIHWEGLPAFRETFPDINIVNDLYVIDQNRYTASGGLSSMEMILDIIAQDHGRDVTRKIANNFQLDRVRNSTSHQRPGNIERMETMPDSIQQAIQLMLENQETPLPSSELARRINTSVRNLERTFMNKLGVSPAKYYLSLRLEKARELLTHTNLSALEIAVQCGFSSSSYFARCFYKQFQRRPSDLRKKPNG